MNRAIEINGPGKTEGIYRINGAKNAVLPELCAALLTEKVTFENVPDISDVSVLMQLLQSLGVNVVRSQHLLTIDSTSLTYNYARYKYVSQMRASILILAPLLYRFGKARVSLPGGCAIGLRPIDYHIKVLEALGAEIVMEGGDIIARIPKGFVGGITIELPYASVGATEHAIMAAVVAKGDTVIEGCAREIEIVDLCRMLQSMGAKIEGEGTHTIYIQGKANLHNTSHKIIADRIELGTIFSFAIATRGSVMVTHCDSEVIQGLISYVEPLGVTIECKKNNTYVLDATEEIHPIELQTGPYPSFPTDLQAQFVALLSTVPGRSIVKENVFENRFLYVPDLVRLGADITLENHVAIINGKDNLIGTEVSAKDLRGGIALMVAGAAAKGRTLIRDVFHIHRGYEKIVEKLINIGIKCKVV